MLASWCSWPLLVLDRLFNYKDSTALKSFILNEDQMFSLTYKHLWWLAAYHTNLNQPKQPADKQCITFSALFVHKYCLRFRCLKLVSWKLL